MVYSAERTKSHSVRALTSSRRQRVVFLPALLARETLIQESKHLGNIELNVLEIELVLVVFLHLEEIIKLKIKFEETAIAS
jgi:hypothetical protein